MKKPFASIAVLAVSALLLTSCSLVESDGNWGSEYHSMATEKVAASGLKGKVFAGKMSASKKDFVKIKFDDISGEELVTAVNVLASMNVPADTFRSVEWPSQKDKEIPNELKFNSTSPDMERVSKFAQVWDQNHDDIIYINDDLQTNYSGVKTQTLIKIKDDLTVDRFKEITNNIKAINGYNDPTAGAKNPAVNMDILFALNNDKISLMAVKPQDNMDEVIDIAYRMLAKADREAPSHPEVSGYKISISNHMNLISGGTSNFSLAFEAEGKGSGNDVWIKVHKFQDDIQSSFYPELSAIGYR
jgi:hypothetical protein